MGTYPAVWADDERFGLARDAVRGCELIGVIKDHSGVLKVKLMNERSDQSRALATVDKDQRGPFAVCVGERRKLRHLTLAGATPCGEKVEDHQSIVWFAQGKRLSL